MKNAIAIVRGENAPDNINKLNEIDIVGLFRDYRMNDSGWAFERYEDRLAFSKAVERNINTIIVEPNFFSGIKDYSTDYKDDWFEKKLIVKALTKLKIELLVVNKGCNDLFDSDLLFTGTSSSEVLTQDDALKCVERYEKLITSLTRLRRKTINQQKGIVTLKGEGKVGGRRSYLETNRELVVMTKELRVRGYTYKDIAKVLKDSGFTNSKGKELAPTQIVRIIKQSENISDENE